MEFEMKPFLVAIFLLSSRAAATSKDARAAAGKTVSNKRANLPEHGQFDNGVGNPGMAVFSSPGSGATSVSGARCSTIPVKRNRKGGRTANRVFPGNKSRYSFRLGHSEDAQSYESPVTQYEWVSAFSEGGSRCQ